jgi:hypothetical protein
VEAGTMIARNDAEKLAKICGLFSSNHDGERASAAAMADAMIRKLGLTWGEVLGLPSSVEPEIEDLIAFALSNAAGILNQWETAFLRSVRRSKHLSRRQLDTILSLVAKVSAARRTAA